jgi:hypothetical protein
MDYSLAKELKDACFPQDGKNCKTYTDINDGALVERIAYPGINRMKFNSKSFTVNYEFM